MPDYSRQCCPPGQEVIAQIKDKDPARLRVFLIYHEFARQDECASEETAAMLYALGSLSRAENVPAETLEAVEALSENMFSGDHPAMEMRYRDLPSDFIKELENITYFHSPFSAFEVMEKLERAD